MLQITFIYRDKYSYPNWNEQTCIVGSVEECKHLYGLGEDCEFKILDIVDVDR